MKTVKKIEPIRQQILQNLRPKTQTCAYCRVSTNSTKQHTSYVAQSEYYRNYIENHSEWEFVDIFADEASGTKVKNRDEFNRMIDECEKGNINLIITKSITRFARNTIDSIETIRKLKSLGVSVFFEKENINTMSEQSEQMITILSSIAQGESENISTNTRWGILKKFLDGSYILSCVAYGYTKDNDSELVIESTQAVIIRRIFDKYLNGKGSYSIAKALNEDNIPTIRSAEKWNDGVVKEILQNPIYTGTLILQKTYTTENLPFNKKRNKGELPQYSIKDSHQPIISEEEFKAVGEIYEYRRKQAKIDNSGKNLNRYELSSKIICKECGGTFRRQKIYIGKPYEKIQWCCKNHIENKHLCSTKAVREDIIQEAYLIMWNKIVSNHKEILYPLLESLNQLKSNQNHLEVDELNKKISELTKQSLILNRVTEKGYMDSAIFISEQTSLNIQIEEHKRKRNLLLHNNDFNQQIEGTQRLLQIIKHNYFIQNNYQEELFTATVENIYISENEITFKLINGLSLTETRDRNAKPHTNRI